MFFDIKQVNSLEKIRLTDKLDYEEVNHAAVLGGERFSYQIAMRSDWAMLKISAKSPLEKYIKIYSVENSPMDYTVYDASLAPSDDDYITKEPGLMPDLLLPIEENGGLVKMVRGYSRAVWIRVDIPSGFAPGKYNIDISVKSIVGDAGGNSVESAGEEIIDTVKTMTLEVLNVSILQQKTIFSQWFHADCIADVHNVEIFSEQHWKLIEKYIETAVDTGMNMLLMPVFTPPLDTMPGTTRPCVQLVDVKKRGDEYTFNFDKVRRWIGICKKQGIKYYEISHLFSQWGSEFSPNIMIDVDGEKKYFFTWGIPCDSEEYVGFLNCFIPQLINVLNEENVKDYTFFHISDEPDIKHIKNYERARKIIKPLIGDIKTCDALSNYSFYEMGLVECPITSTKHIHEFLEHEVENQWAYYCCGNINLVGNRLLAMPSHRNRILGLQMYKYNVKGFLQWGYNFYNSELSAYKIDPYRTTSGDLSFPSGDAFTVYPGKEGALLSLRALVFYEGLQDISVCCMLEKLIGKEKTVEMIEKEAGMKLTFSEYPRSSGFLPGLRQKMLMKIKEKINTEENK